MRGEDGGRLDSGYRPHLDGLRTVAVYLGPADEVATYLALAGVLPSA